jgi:hypothetical protein
MIEDFPEADIEFDAVGLISIVPSAFRWSRA